jgi:hypothetical protein
MLLKSAIDLVRLRQVIYVEEKQQSRTMAPMLSLLIMITGRIMRMLNDTP